MVIVLAKDREVYALATLLHPFLKGTSLNKRRTVRVLQEDKTTKRVEIEETYKDYWEKHIIENHESTDEWKEKTRESLDSMQKSLEENDSESGPLKYFEKELYEEIYTTKKAMKEKYKLIKKNEK